MKRTLLILLFISTAWVALRGQENGDPAAMAMEVKTVSQIRDTTSRINAVSIETDNSWVDTLVIHAKPSINDYHLIGVYAGAGGALGNFNPTYKNTIGFVPLHVGIQYTNFGKMFGLLPYFGFQAGVELSQEGYTMKEVDGYISHIMGYSKATMTVLHGYYNAMVHVDFWKMRVMAHVGAYAGARLSIKRGAIDGDTTPYTVTIDGQPYKTEEFQNSFLPFDNKFDYGVKAGAGFAFIFDPIEIHINGVFKHSLNNLYAPDYASPYYYRWAYPMSFYVSVGVHYQLTSRVGRERRQLKKEAWEIYKAEQKYSITNE